MKRRTPKVEHLLYLFTSAFLVRAISIIVFRWKSDDSLVYLDLAKNLLDSGRFAITTPEGLVTITARPPLYPFLLAGVGLSEPITLILQALLAAATGVLVYLMARKWDEAVGWLAAGLFLIFPLANYYTAGLLTETLYTFLMVLGCYLWGEKHWKGAGVVFGLSLLARAATFPLLIVMALTIPFQTERRKFATMLAIAVLVPSFWMIRNSMIEGKPTLTQSGGYGINLLFGTYDTSTAPADVWSGVLAEMKPYQGNESSEAVRRISADPIGWLKIRARQYPRLFFESGDYLLGGGNKVFSEALREGDWLVVGVKVGFLVFYLSFYLLVLGGLWVMRHDLWANLHIFLFPVLLAVLHLPMWIETRYFLPAVPFLCIPAAMVLVRVRFISPRRPEFPD